MARRRTKGTGRVYEDPKGSGRWWAQLPERDGKAGPKWRVQDKKAGEAELEEKLRQLKNKVKVYERATTVGQWMDCWLNTVVASGDLKPTTLESYEQVIRLYIHTQPIAKLRLADVEADDLQEWVAGVVKLKSERTKKRLAARTVHNAYARLRAALIVAFDGRRIAWLPPKSIRLPTVDEDERRALTVEECNRLLDAARTSRLYTLIMVAIATGMREGEIIGLQWSAIDWQKLEIRLDSQLQRVAGAWERLKLKNRKRRIIPIDSELAAALHALRAVQLAEKLKNRAQWQEHDLVFSTKYGTPIESSNLGRDFAAIVARAGLGRLTFHELRHTAGSLMLQAGETLITVSKVLGHSSVEVTSRIYAHSYEEDKRRAVSGVMRRLRRAEGGNQ